MIKVSIIVPIYNAEKYLEKCLDSIINQTLKEIEIILINDGSTDNTYKIINSYAKKDERIVVINQENMGPSISRNTGISIAKGKYIGFVDCDDYIENEMYETLYNLSNEKKVEIAMCNYNEKYIDFHKELIVKALLKSSIVYTEDEIKKEIISTFSKNENYGYFSLVNKIYLRQWILEKNLKIDVNRDHGEDWWFNINAFMMLNSFIYIDKTLYNYVHINKNSLMYKYRKNQFELFLDGRKKIISITPREYLDMNELDKRFFYEFSSYIIRTFKEVKDKTLRKQLINNVLNNEEVKSVCNKGINIPIYYKIITNAIKYKLNWIVYNAYKTISLLK